MSAFSVEWEVHKYYDAMLPPKHETVKQRLTAALKPGDTFAVNLLDDPDDASAPGSRGHAVADWYSFEVFIRYKDVAKHGFLSYVRVGRAGRIQQQDHAVGLFRRPILPAEIWCRHFGLSLWIHIKVRTRPRIYAALKWVSREMAARAELQK